MLVLLLTFAVILSACGGGARLLSVGDKAPNFELKTTSGTSKSLSEYQGKNVFLIFEQIPCAYCDAQRPHIQNALKSSGIDVSVINIYCENSAATVEKDIKAKGLTDFGIALVDTEAAVGTQCGFGKAYPYNVLIDGNGIVKAVKIGPFTNSDEVLNWLKSL
jgi:peroxiredoxin